MLCSGYAKGDLISESFSLWLHHLKNVLNHYPDHYPSKEKMVAQGDGAKVKNFLRLSHL